MLSGRVSGLENIRTRIAGAPTRLHLRSGSIISAQDPASAVQVIDYRVLIFRAGRVVARSAGKIKVQGAGFQIARNTLPEGAYFDSVNPATSEVIATFSVFGRC